MPRDMTSCLVCVCVYYMYVYYARNTGGLCSRLNSVPKSCQCFGTDPCSLSSVFDDVGGDYDVDVDDGDDDDGGGNDLLLLLKLERRPLKLKHNCPSLSQIRLRDTKVRKLLSVHALNVWMRTDQISSSAHCQSHGPILSHYLTQMPRISLLGRGRKSS